MTRTTGPGLLWESLIARPSDSSARGRLQGDRAGGTRRLPFDRRCAATTKSGRRCRGRIRQGSEFCPFHDPELTAEGRRRNAAKGGRSHHRLSHLPDGYLRKLTSRRAVGEAMDRLYREVRVGIITPEMGRVLFNILTRIQDSGLFEDERATTRSGGRAKADKLRPKFADLLTQAERREWRQAVADAPAAFLHNQSAKPTAPKESDGAATSAHQADASDKAIRLALTAAS